MRSRLLPFLALLFAVVVFFGYTKPLYEGPVATKRSAIISDTTALAAAATYQDKSTTLSTAETTLNQESLKNINAFLPDSVGNVGLILDLNSLAARTGIALSSINVTGATNSTDAVSASPVASAELSISAKGTYSSFVEFLRQLESSRRLLDVTGVTVSAGDSGVYSYALTARFYWLR